MKGMEMSIGDRLKLYDWTFSATAETVVGVLLVATMVVAATLS